MTCGFLFGFQLIEKWHVALCSNLSQFWPNVLVTSSIHLYLKQLDWELLFYLLWRQSIFSSIQAKERFWNRHSARLLSGTGSSRRYDRLQQPWWLSPLTGLPLFFVANVLNSCLQSTHFTNRNVLKVYYKCVVLVGFVVRTLAFVWSLPSGFSFWILLLSESLNLSIFSILVVVRGWWIIWYTL